SHNLRQESATYDVLLWDRKEDNRLLEAMSHGCIPLVLTHNDARAPGFVKDGFNGFVADRENIDRLRSRLLQLRQDHEIRRNLSRHAHESVARSFYHSEDMVDDFMQLFRRIGAADRDRPAGELSPPPARIGSQTIFPVDYELHIPTIGSFITRRDAKDFLKFVPRYKKLLKKKKPS
ncbi:MAG: hypothetical protein AAF492_30415, partial [Verrucomicrobiota bacterium]